MSAAFARSILLALLAWALALPAFGQESTLARIKRGGEIVLGYIEGAAPFSDSDASG